MTTIELRLQGVPDQAPARLALWLKQEGEFVREGEVVAEVETDKTNVEIEAPATGVLQRIHVAAGTDKVGVDQVLAEILPQSEPSPRTSAAAPAAATGAPPVAEASAPPSASVVHADDAGGAPPAARDVQAPSVSGAQHVERGPAPSAATTVDAATPEAVDVSATPLARRIAAIRDIDLRHVQGTGPKGRVTKSDVLRAAGLATADVAAPRSAAPPPAVPLPPGGTDVPLSAMRRVAAERLTLSKQTVPHFYLEVTCRLDALDALRTTLHAQTGWKVTVTDFVVKALATALQAVPAANAAWAGSSIRQYADADIAVAVATDGGLITPIVRGAQKLSVLETSEELRRLSARARSGKLAPAEYSGGTCTLSNLGMYGVDALYPIVNPPHACIVGIGAIRQVPLVDNGHVVAGKVATCTLAADHRVLDGATGAALLAELRRSLEQPMSLLLRSFPEARSHEAAGKERTS